MELRNERLFDVKVRAWRKWLLPILAVVVVVGLPAMWFGQRVVSRLQQERLYRKATKSLEQGHVESGALFLRRVLDLNSNHLEATRALAGLADAYLPSEAPRLRERVCELVPASYPDATAWARAALRVGDIAHAEDALERMKKIGPPDAAWYEIAGRVALGSGRLAEARAQFTQALEMDPANEANRLELAAIEVRLPDPAVRNGAREKLKLLRTNPKFRHAALRALIQDLMERGVVREALKLARDFVHDPEATFPDRMQYLAILRAKEDPSFAFMNAFEEKASLPLELASVPREPSFAVYLGDLQAEAREAPAKAATLISFLNSRGLSLLACEWAGTLPQAVVAAPPIAPQLAESYLATVDWRRLEELVAVGDWGLVEFLRFAYRARVAEVKEDRAAMSSAWTMAVQLAEYRDDRLSMLGRMASAWGWTNEKEEILWISARNSKHPREALEELAEILRERRDTPKLFEVWSSLLALDPKDVTARKNWARLSFLLKGDRFQTGTMAQELYRLHPEDPHIAITFALVQNQREYFEEALGIMNRLPAELLRLPEVAGYHAVILAGNRQKAEALKYFAYSKGAPLLREELAMFEEVRLFLLVK